MPLADGAQHAVEPVSGIHLGQEKYFDPVGEARFLNRDLDEMKPRLRREEAVPGSEVIDVRIGLGSLFIDLHPSLYAVDAYLTLLESDAMEARNHSGVNNHLLKAAFAQGAPHEIQVGAMKWIERAEEHADPALRIEARPNVG